MSALNEHSGIPLTEVSLHYLAVSTAVCILGTFRSSRTQLHSLAGTFHAVLLNAHGNAKNIFLAMAIAVAAVLGILTTASNACTASLNFLIRYRIQSTNGIILTRTRTSINGVHGLGDYFTAF